MEERDDPLESVGDDGLESNQDSSEHGDAV